MKNAALLSFVLFIYYLSHLETHSILDSASFTPPAPQTHALIINSCTDTPMTCTFIVRHHAQTLNTSHDRRSCPLKILCLVTKKRSKIDIVLVLLRLTEFQLRSIIAGWYAASRL